VRLRTPSDRGTGFFVAPGMILTCYHVIRETKPGEIEVNWRDVSYRSWKVDTIEQLDLALVWVDIAEHPCVYLDREAQPGDKLYSYGYPDQDRDGASITVECEGPGDKGQLLTIKDENVRPGFSGAPLLNQRTLKVCGMIQRERQIKVNANPKILRGLGGQAVPTGIILAQWPELEEQNRQFYQQDKRWLEKIPISCPHNLPRSGVVKFVGRDEVLATLHQQLQQNEPVAISAVAGMGGIGKTELALQYAWRHREEYRGGICWLQGSEVGAKHWGNNLSVEPKVSYPNALPSEDVKTDFLANLYKSQGRYSEAEPLYLEAVDILFHSLGSEHPNTVTVWENFVDFLEKVVREGQDSVLSEHPMVQEELAKIKESEV